MISVSTALRPWTFSASLTPVILGATLSYKSCGEIQFILLLVTVATVVAVNGAGNLVNTYFDFMRVMASREVQDHPRRNERTTTTVPGRLEQTEIVDFAAYLYGFGMACLGLLVWLSSARSDHLAALFFGGLSSSFIYTGAIGLKYYILGDILVILTFGPLSVLFSFVVQCGKMLFSPLILALPLALSTEAIVHSKHAREMVQDKRAGVISLATLLGKQGSYFLFTLLLFIPYLMFVVWGTRYSLPLALPVLTVPYAFYLERTFREQGPVRSISTGTAKLNFAISLLFVTGCLFSRDIPFLSVT